MGALIVEWLETQISNLLSWKTRFGKWVHDWHTWLSKRVDNLDDNVDEVVKTVNRIPDMVNEAIGDAYIDVLSAVERLYITPLSHYVDAIRMDVVDWIGSISSDMSKISKDVELIFDFVGHIDDIIDVRIEGFKDKIIGWVQDKFISIVEHVLEQEVKQ